MSQHPGLRLALQPACLGPQSPSRHCRMAGANVLLNSGHEAVGSCHRERVGARPGVGDKDRGVAKERVRTSWRIRGLLS